MLKLITRKPHRLFSKVTPPPYNQDDTYPIESRRTKSKRWKAAKVLAESLSNWTNKEGNIEYRDTLLKAIDTYMALISYEGLDPEVKGKIYNREISPVPEYIVSILKNSPFITPALHRLIKLIFSSRILTLRTYLQDIFVALGSESFQALLTTLEDEDYEKVCFAEEVLVELFRQGVRPNNPNVFVDKLAKKLKIQEEYLSVTREAVRALYQLNDTRGLPHLENLLEKIGENVASTTFDPVGYLRADLIQYIKTMKEASTKQDKDAKQTTESYLEFDDYLAEQKKLEGWLSKDLMNSLYLLMEKPVPAKDVINKYFKNISDVLREALIAMPVSERIRLYHVMNYPVGVWKIPYVYGSLDSMHSGLMESFKGTVSKHIESYGSDDTGWSFSIQEHFDCDDSDVPLTYGKIPSVTMFIESGLCSYWVGRYLNEENEDVYIGIGYLLYVQDGLT